MKTFYIICIAFAIISCESIANKNLNEAEFPIEGTWYVNDNGEAYTDNTLNFAEYTFGEPDQSGGKLLGKLRLMSFDGEEREAEYEIIEKNVLNIYILNENDYTFTYTYYPEEEKVEMNYAGQERTLVREKPLTEEEIQTQRWMDHIADVDWKSSGAILRFDKPTKEGNLIKGKLILKAHGDKAHLQYERTFDGQMTVKQLELSEHGANYGFGNQVTMLLDKEAKNLTITSTNGSSIYVRSE